MEGDLIANLVSTLPAAIDNKNIFCSAAYDQCLIIGVIFFSRLFFKEDIYVLMLVSVAVSTKCQGEGVGQSFIQYSIHEMQNQSVDVIVTYWAPSFYSKVGFQVL